MTTHYAFDAEIESGLSDFLAKYPPTTPPEKGDWKTLRENADVLLKNMFNIFPSREDVSVQKFTTHSKDGAEIYLHWYTSKNIQSESAIIYAHGGGRIAGSVDVYNLLIEHYVHLTGVPFLAVGYRLAPEVQGTVHSEDVFAGLLWLKENSNELGIDPNRIAVMGDSAGGGIAAGAAILARDENIPLAKQILIYPMLDSRTVLPDEKLLPFVVWNYDSNFTGWQASLGREADSSSISPVAIPAYLTDFDNLAPAYIEVGFLDIFRDENIAYLQKLSKAGIPVEFHLHPGTPHAFEVIAPNSSIAKRAMLDRIRTIQSV
ncbi:alpha/beta hydrolase [Flavobacterium columnare]|uniref:alpha/beta hydrolase n=1 Tax=Flavobacterium TaxID=237 RepID=UPI0018967F03|nr:alpha/beta hydrolase [Flavobacterium columnare]MBF6652942.1 alpha/beta hydrolase [Flavobacterium columnare]MBF6657552.1 alpha/beta hydrolase [Flavobacterium columnare]